MIISLKFQELIIQIEEIIRKMDKYLIEIEKMEGKTNGERK